jgi:ferredoxin
MGGPGGGPGGGPPGIRMEGFPKVYPKIDMGKCVYPRCDACVEGCPVGAIDMTEAVKGSFASSPLIIKQACVSCGLCEKMCIYDAMTFDDVIPKSKHVIDMAKCTHPKCNICVDECSMDCIDFSYKQPVFHSNCEGCDLCYSVCPKDAITVPNLAEAQLRLLMTSPNHPFVKNVEKWEDAGRFRRLIPISEVGFSTPAYKNKNAPRIVVNDETDEVTYCKDACKV